MINVEEYYFHLYLLRSGLYGGAGGGAELQFPPALPVDGGGEGEEPGQAGEGGQAVRRGGGQRQGQSGLQSSAGVQ